MSKARLRRARPGARLTLYRCAQEALTNIRKHADATRALMRLRVDEQEAELLALDNGQRRVI